MQWYFIILQEILNLSLNLLVDSWQSPLNAWKVFLVGSFSHNVVLEHLDVSRLGAVNK